MEKKSRFFPGQKIKIIGTEANNPQCDLDKIVTIQRVTNMKDKQGDPEEALWYLGEDRIIYYVFSKDVEIIEKANNIIRKKIEEGESELLIEMGLITEEGFLTAKGYEFIEKFD